MTKNSIMHILQEAVSRGVNVTIITNETEDFNPKYRWEFQEHWWGQSALYLECEFYAYVQDNDGDMSWFCVKHYGVEVYTKNFSEGDHFTVALKAAEDVLNTIKAPRCML